MNTIDSTKLSRLKEIVHSIEKHAPLTIEDPEVTFEFMMASCFPSIWNNIQVKLREEYERGVKDGLEMQENLKKD